MSALFSDETVASTLQPCGTLDCRMRSFCGRDRHPTQWEVRKDFKPNKLVCKGFVTKRKAGE
jgi:hypothetical protein